MTPIIESVGETHNRISNEIALKPNFASLNKPQAFGLILSKLNLTGSVTSHYHVELFDQINKNALYNQSIVLGKYNNQVFTALKDLKTPEEFKVVANSLRIVVDSDNSLTEMQKQQFRETLSIMYNSGKYWHEAYNDAKHPWHKILLKKIANEPVSTSAEPNATFDWITFLHVDATQYFYTYDALMYSDTFPDDLNNYITQAASLALTQAIFASARAAGWTNMIF